MAKKVILFIITLVLVFAVVTAAVINIAGTGRRYIGKDTQITAVVADVNKIFATGDSQAVFSVKMNEMTQYFKDNGINTVIIPFNNGKAAIGNAGVFYNSFPQAEYIKDDILTAIKRPLEKSGVQILLEIDCNGLSGYETVQTIQQICSKYRTAGVIINNPESDASVINNVSEMMKRVLKKYWLGVKAENMDSINNILSGTANLFIFSSITESQYTTAKKADYSQKTILLDYNSTDFYSNLFVLSNLGDYDGAVIAEYTVPDADLSLINNLKDTSYPLDTFSFEIDTSFTVTNPSKDTESYSGGVFVTGICDKTQPVYINGVYVETAQDGTFGHYLELTEGENVIQVVQGNNIITRTVTKKSYNGTGSVKIKHDNTQKAKPGQVVQTINPLTSILSDPDDDSSIIDGIQQGVQLIVEETVRTKRDDKYTYAYQLSNGGYILAENVEWVNDNDYTQSVLGNIYFKKLEDGNENLVLQVSGKPAVVSEFNDTGLSLKLLNTSASQEFYPEAKTEYTNTIESRFADKYAVYTDDGYTTIRIENSLDQLWGYNVEYCEGDIVKIYLKKAPHKVKGAKPLTGVSIILDAGHGGNDPGALAVGGIKGPDEKDVNLAMAQAVKNCLEKLGATVTLTRSDDTYLTLQQRRDITNTVKPDLFISLHHNSLVYTVDASKAYGFESYYFTDQSKYVAEIMTDRIASSAERNNRGYYYGYYYVLRNSIAPCVLNEYGFINNPYEYANLHTNKDIYKAAIGTALAVLDIIPE